MARFRTVGGVFILILSRIEYLGCYIPTTRIYVHLLDKIVRNSRFIVIVLAPSLRTIEKKKTCFEINERISPGA